jgi:general secretion pathway protein A
MNAAVPAEIKPAPLGVDSDTSETEEIHTKTQDESSPLGTSPVAAAETDESLADSVARHASNETDNNNRYKNILGRVTLRRNETLSGLIKEIYGNFNFKHFKSLILANPNIEDPDVVKIGQTILFPAIPVAISPLPNKVWWVSIGDKDSLEDALQILRVLPKNGPQIRLVPYWNQRTGTKFALLHKKYFLNKSKALKQLQTLQSSFSSRVRLLASWDEDTIFFADPFFGRRPKKSKRVIN